MSAMTDEYYQNRKPTTPTPAEMILILGFWLKPSGSILTTWGWGNLLWGVLTPTGFECNDEDSEAKIILEFFADEDIASYGFRLKALNGVVMMTSKSYTTYLKAVNGWRTVQKELRVDDIWVRYRWSKELQ